jgi:hypothetical protein
VPPSCGSGRRRHDSFQFYASSSWKTLNPTGYGMVDTGRRDQADLRRRRHRYVSTYVWYPPRARLRRAQLGAKVVQPPTPGPDDDVAVQDPRVAASASCKSRPIRCGAQCPRAPAPPSALRHGRWTVGDSVIAGAGRALRLVCRATRPRPPCVARWLSPSFVPTPSTASVGARHRPPGALGTCSRRGCTTPRGDAATVCRVPRDAGLRCRRRRRHHIDGWASTPSGRRGPRFAAVRHRGRGIPATTRTVPAWRRRCARSRPRPDKPTAGRGRRAGAEPSTGHRFVRIGPAATPLSSATCSPSARSSHPAPAVSTNIDVRRAGQAFLRRRRALSSARGRLRGRAIVPSDDRSVASGAGG